MSGEHNCKQEKAIARLEESKKDFYTRIRFLETSRTEMSKDIETLVGRLDKLISVLEKVFYFLLTTLILAVMGGVGYLIKLILERSV